jgi:hypothetical protein
VTVTQLLARFYSQIDDSGSAPSNVQPQEALDAMNEGQELAAMLTLCLMTTATFTLTAGEAFYTLRGAFPDFLAPLYFTTAGGRIMPATLADLDAGNDAWQVTAGAPSRYFTLGFNFLGLTPQPPADTAAQFTYARAPIALVNSIDAAPELPEEDHQALVWYAIWRTRLKEGAQGLARGKSYLARYLAAMKLRGDAVRARSQAAGYDILPFEIRLQDKARRARPAPEQAP